MRALLAALRLIGVVGLARAKEVIPARASRVIFIVESGGRRSDKR